MQERRDMKRLIFVLVALIALASATSVAVADTSENYAMVSSTVTGGGNTSASETHVVHDSLAEPVTETHTSANYILHSGHCSAVSQLQPPVPEIASVVLIIIGLMGLGISIWYVRRKNKILTKEQAVS